jgi:predicted Ser/Thr protein kinase
VSAQIISALRKRADVLEAHASTGVPPKLATVSEAMTVTPGLLSFLAGEFRKLADEAERLS